MNRARPSLRCVPWPFTILIILLVIDNPLWMIRTCHPSYAGFHFNSYNLPGQGGLDGFANNSTELIPCALVQGCDHHKRTGTDLLGTAERPWQGKPNPPKPKYSWDKCVDPNMVRSSTQSRAVKTTVQSTLHAPTIGRIVDSLAHSLNGRARLPPFSPR